MCKPGDIISIGTDRNTFIVLDDKGDEIECIKCDFLCLVIRTEKHYLFKKASTDYKVIRPLGPGELNYLHWAIEYIQNQGFQPEYVTAP